MLIVYEGNDKSGKTFHSELTASQLSATLYPTPIEPFKSMRHIVDGGSQDASFLFYMASNLCLSEKLDTSKTYVFDRFFLSTIANHNIRDKKRYEEKFEGFMEMLPEPTITFLLKPTDEIIIDRLKSEGKSVSDNYLLQNPEKITEINEEFIRLLKKMNFVYFEINTNKSKESANEEILGILGDFL
jgi:thymidylate kinase